MCAGAPSQGPADLICFFSFLLSLFLSLQQDSVESDTQKSSPQKRRVSDVKSRRSSSPGCYPASVQPLPGVTSLHGLCCLMVPGLPFSSVMGSVRMRKLTVHVVHISRRACSAAAMGCLIMWQWCEEIFKDVSFKRRGIRPRGVISQWHAVASGMGRAPLAVVRMLRECFHLLVVASVANAKLPSGLISLFLFLCQVMREVCANGCVEPDGAGSGSPVHKPELEKVTMLPRHH